MNVLGAKTAIYFNDEDLGEFRNKSTLLAYQVERYEYKIYLVHKNIYLVEQLIRAIIIARQCARSGEYDVVKFCEFQQKSIGNPWCVVERKLRVDL